MGRSTRVLDRLPVRRQDREGVASKRSYRAEMLLVESKQSCRAIPAREDHDRGVCQADVHVPVALTEAVALFAMLIAFLILFV